MNLVLYDNELDADCYSVRLLLSMLSLPYERVSLDIFPGAESAPGQEHVPVLVDGGRHVPGALLALEHLARTYAPSWLPSERDAGGHWLRFAATDLLCARQARSEALLTTSGPSTVVVAAAAKCLQTMDDHLTEREFDGDGWFVGSLPSIVDVAFVAPVCLSTDYGLEHDVYPALRRWIRRVRALPGFLTMPGIPNYY
jgi:glutathione S-transferase